MGLRQWWNRRRQPAPEPPAPRRCARLDIDENLSDPELLAQITQQTGNEELAADLLATVRDLQRRRDPDT